MRMGMIVAMIMTVMIMTVMVVAVMVVVTVVMSMVIVAVMAVIMAMICIGPDAPDMVMMSLLPRTNLGLVSQNLGAILTQLAVHRRGTLKDFAGPVRKGIEHEGVIAQVGRFDEIDLGEERGDAACLLVNPLHQDAGK